MREFFRAVNLNRPAYGFLHIKRNICGMIKSDMAANDSFFGNNRYIIEGDNWLSLLVTSQASAVYKLDIN